MNKNSAIRGARFLLPLVLLAPLAGLEGSRGRSTPFEAPRILRMGAKAHPNAVVAADFDGDGKPDLAVASAGTEELTVFLGNGKGEFRDTGRPAATGPSPTEIAVGDFNRDGRLDLAIANHGVSRVTVLLGDGRGGFAPAPGSPLAVRSLPHPHTIDSCDVDGDGKLDLVIDSWEEKRMTLLLGDGHGGFRTPGIPIEVGRTPYRNLRLKDLDGDGKCDIVAPNMAGRGVILLFGDGHGGFRGAGEPVIPAGPSPFVVELGDVNGDGRTDLVVANYSGQITDPSGDALTFLLGDGKGHFRLGPTIPTGHGPFDVAVGDIDGDGFADAATSDHGSRSLTVAFGGKGGLSPSRVTTVSLVDAPNRVILTDLNGDHKADAVTVSEAAHTVTILLAR